jgi:hypothetical protein
MLHYASLVTACRFDANPSNLDLGQPVCKLTPASQGVGHLPTLAAAMNGNIELAFGSIDPAVVMLVCVIFVDPAL